MKTDRVTKILLALIALGLFANTFWKPTQVRASGNLKCTGSVKVNPWGTSEPTIGGYNIDVTCAE